MKRVTVHLLIFNARQYLERCIRGVENQNYPEIELIISDNGSQDGSGEFILQHYPQYLFFKHKKNLGFSRGHNQIIKETSTEYFMPLNPDLFMTPNFIAEKVRAMEKAKDIGMVCGKLLQPEKREGGYLIDSTGIVLTLTRRNRDRDQGRWDRGQREKEEFIFAPYGAAPLYRREMLEELKIGEEYFDEDFFLYREEVDLAWRAQNRGWKCLYTPWATAYHLRRYSPRKRRQMPRELRQLQFRNRYLLLSKNEKLRDMILRFPLLLGFEILVFFYVLFCEPHLFRAYYQFFKLFPRVWKKRRFRDKILV